MLFGGYHVIDQPRAIVTDDVYMLDLTRMVSCVLNFQTLVFVIMLRVHGNGFPTVRLGLCL